MKRAPFIIFNFIFILIPNYLWAHDRCLMDDALPCGMSSREEAMAKGNCTVNQDGTDGGYVAKTATVKQAKEKNLSYLGPRVQICDEAQVNSRSVKILDNAKIYGKAQISGSATIKGNAQVYGNAKVFVDALVTQNAKVYGDAEILYNAKIGGQAEVYGHANVLGRAIVTENAKVFGNAWIEDEAKVYGEAQVYENAKIKDDARVFGSAKVYGDATIEDWAKILDQAQILGNAVIGNEDIIAGDTIVNGSEISFDVDSIHLEQKRKNLNFTDRQLPEFGENFSSLLERRKEELSQLPNAELFQRLQQIARQNPEWGVKLADPMIDEEIGSFEQLEKVLKDYFQFSHGPEGLRSVLLQIVALLDIYGENTAKQLDLLEIDPEGLRTEIRPIPYRELFEKKENFPEKLQEYFARLNDEKILQDLGYLDPGDHGDCQRKEKELAAFFNEIREIENFIQGHPGFSIYFSAYKSRSPSFKVELSYKLHQLMENTKEIPLDEDQKKTILQSLIHAGRHCPDAKKAQIDNLYFAFCSEDEELLQNLTYPKTDLFARSYLVAHQLKEEILESLINSNLPKKDGESLTRFPATWDFLAPGLGLHVKASAYPGFAMRRLKQEMILKEYTPGRLLKRYIEVNKDRWKESDVLGPLQPLVDQGQFAQRMGIGELQRFGLFRFVQKVKEEEDEK